MPPLLIRQPSFHGGEVSPNLFSRTDIPSRKYAVASLRNFIPTATGAALNRPGFIYVANVRDQTRRARLVPFTFSTSQSYLLEFGHLYVRVYQGGVQIGSTSRRRIPKPNFPSSSSLSTPTRFASRIRRTRRRP
jgi:hypothetical protein